MLIDIIIVFTLAMITQYIIGSVKKKKQKERYNQLEIEEKLKYENFREYSKKNAYSSDLEQFIFFGYIFVWTIVVLLIKNSLS